jgi:hypothetical protein
VPSVRFSRDKRGYEYVYLVHTPTRRGKPGRTRVLYWYRTPPGIRIGRQPFDEEVRRTLEQQNPGVTFDWDAIVATPMPPPDMTEFWRERRRAEKAARQERRAAEAGETAADSATEAEEAGGSATDAAPATERQPAAEDVPETEAPVAAPERADSRSEKLGGADGSVTEGDAAQAERKRRRRRGGRRRRPDAPGTADAAPDRENAPEAGAAEAGRDAPDDPAAAGDDIDQSEGPDPTSEEQ